jgi:hypothetical protein
MAAPEHGPEHRRADRRRVDPRLLLLAAFVAGLAVAAAVAGVWSMTTTEPAATPTRPSSAASAASPRSSPSPSAPAPSAANLRQGLMTKPLTQLVPGDRVVYNMQVCRFRGFVGGDIDVSRVSCPSHRRPFQTKTEYLVPVEPSAGD